jgi:multiple sugar transport system permease protein
MWQRIRYVILPLLRPSLQVALILRTILAIQVFSVVIVLGGGTENGALPPDRKIGIGR